MKKNDFGRINFVAGIKTFGPISVLAVLVSIFYLMFHGLNWGIDFAGGTEVQVKFQQEVSMADFRSEMSSLDLPGMGLQNFGDQNEFILRFQVDSSLTDDQANQAQADSVNRIKTVLSEKFSEKGPEIRRVDSVGPQVGNELKRSGFLAVFYSLLVILIYVGLRFDYQYAPGAVICLFHDAMITLGIFVLLGKEVNIPILASVLTLIGFSLNDTIVVFDRIRENQKAFRDETFDFVVNRSINDMLFRTIITTVTTILAAGSLLVFTDGTLADIGLVMLIGIVIGTYSSIYVAAPVTWFFNSLRAKSVTV